MEDGNSGNRELRMNLGISGTRELFQDLGNSRFLISRFQEDSLFLVP